MLFIDAIRAAVTADPTKSPAAIALDLGCDRHYVSTVRRTVLGRESQKATEIANLLLAGELLEDVAARTGISIYYVRRVAHYRRIPAPRRRTQREHVVELAKAETDLDDVAKETGASINLVRHYAKVAGVDVPPAPSLIGEAERLFRSGSSRAEVKARLGISETTVRRAARRVGVSIPDRTKRSLSPIEAAAWDAVDRGLSYAQAAKHLGTTRSAVAGAVKRARRFGVGRIRAKS